jgi:UDP-N-acetylglucosamine 2-epimerase
MAFRILSVVGSRPNFMKVAPICEQLKGSIGLGTAEEIHHILVHTGATL